MNFMKNSIKIGIHMYNKNSFTKYQTLCSLMGFSDYAQILFEACLCCNKANKHVLSNFYFCAI